MLRPKSPQGLAPGPYRFGPLSWIIFAVLMVWNIWSFLPTPTSQVAFPYSAFVGHVAAGNVSAVRIVGDQIAGTFVQPIVWPDPPAAAGVKDAEETPGAADQPKAADQRTPATYSTFRTAFPAVVGDASLMLLLDAHHLVTDLATPSLPRATLLLSNGLPVVLLVLLIVWIGRRAARSIHRAAPDTVRVTVMSAVRTRRHRSDLDDRRLADRRAGAIGKTKAARSSAHIGPRAGHLRPPRIRRVRHPCAATAHANSSRTRCRRAPCNRRRPTDCRLPR